MVLETDSSVPGIVEKIEGILQQIVYRNSESGFIVARLKVAGQINPVTVTGNLVSISEGESLRCTGSWTSHPRFGRQFRIDSFEAVPPSTETGIFRYLSSGTVKGIGPKLAARIVKRFGLDTLDVIDSHPERLKEIPGIGERRVADIASAWRDQKEVREIMVFLRSYGVGAARSAKIHARYGSATVDLIKKNPYRLCEEIFGIGFRTADRIALNMGVETNAASRIRAAVSYLLERAAEEGHLCLPRDRLLQRAEEELGCGPEPVEEQIAARCDEGALVIDDKQVPPFLREEDEELRQVFLRRFHEAEIGVVRTLRSLKHSTKKKAAIDFPKALRWAEGRTGFELEESQAEAVRAALREPVVVITGGPGVGKTTIIRQIAAILHRKGFKIALAAPTGRAAKRLSEATGFPASTIHRLLKFKPRTFRFEYNGKNPLPCEALIMDESSMLDVPVAEKLLDALPGRSKLILVGDADQLPPVGPGDMLRAMIESGRFPVVRLNKLFRQSESGGIHAAAHAVNSGTLPDFTPASDDGEIYFIDQPDAEKTARVVVKLVKERIPARFGFDPLRDVQILTPMHRGPAGTENLNALLKEALNPGAAGITRFGRTFSPGDKVMQVRNNYEKEVFNGDIGFVDSADQEKGEVVVRIDNRFVTYGKDSFDELVHAWCISVHKSQGCEFPVVVIPLLTQHFMLLKRNLLYTGITRARKLLVIVGAQKALRIAVGNDTLSERHSLLENRMKNDKTL